MKIALFYYDGFAEFEIVLVGLVFHREHDIIAVALENREYKSEECQRFCLCRVGSRQLKFRTDRPQPARNGTKNRL